MVQSPTVLPLRTLLTLRGFWWWSLTRQLMRFPTLMASVSFVLVSIHATGGPAAGGLMVTSFVMTETFLAPVAARMMDRLGPTDGAQASLGLSACTMFGLAAAVAVKSPVLVLVLLAGLAGLLMAGQGSALRTMLGAVVPPTLLGQALAVDAVMLEGLVVGAPLLAAAAAAVTPPFAVVTMATCHLVAALLVRRYKRLTTPAARVMAAGPTPVSNTLWRNPRFIFWLLISVAFGHAIGTAETAALPLAVRLGGGFGNGASLIAVEAGASVTAGLAYAALSHRLSLSAVHKASIMLALMIASCIGMALAPNLVTVGGLLVVLGACIAPFDVVRSQAAEIEVPQNRKSEAFSLLGATHALGFSLAGLALAVFPLRGMLLAGAVSGVCVLTLAPLLLRQR